MRGSPSPSPSPAHVNVSRWAGVLRIVGLDVLAPLLVFQLALAGGVPTVWSLILSGCPPLIGVTMDWVRWRSIEVVGMIVCGGIVLSVALALLTDDPRLVLLEGVLVTFVFGLVCLWSLSAKRPLIFYFAQAFYGGPRATAGADIDVEYTTYRQARHFWQSVTVVWAAGYMAESLVRAVLVWLATTSTALLINRLVPWLVYIALMGWTFWWGNRVRGRASDTLDEDVTDHCG